MKKIIVIITFLAAITGSLAVLDRRRVVPAVFGHTTKMYGSVIDQNKQPVPFCPLVGDWELFPGDFGQAKVIMSDEHGRWSFQRRGVSRIFVKVGTDCHQRHFPGYIPGGSGTKITWLVGGHPQEIKNPYTISVLVDTNKAAKPFTPGDRDYLGEQYKRLRQRHPSPYSKSRNGSEALQNVTTTIITPKR